MSTIGSNNNVSNNYYTTTTGTGETGDIDTNTIENSISETENQTQWFNDIMDVTTSNYGAIANSPQVRDILQSHADFLRTGDQAYMDKFAEQIKALPQNGNILETLMVLMKESVKQTNEDKRYWLKLLNECNTIGKFISQQQKVVADASQALSEKERSSSKPEKQTTYLAFDIPNTETLDKNGNPVVNEKISDNVTRNSMGTFTKLLDTANEDLKTRRDEVKTSFQACDQRSNQGLQSLTQLSKTLAELGNIANKSMM